MQCESQWPGDAIAASFFAAIISPKPSEIGRFHLQFDTIFDTIGDPAGAG
jgi:hypothetical protein